MEAKKLQQQINQLIKEAQELSATGVIEKDTLLTQAYKQIEVILKLNRLLDEKLFELTIINEIGNIINSIENYEEVMKSILSILRTILNYDVGGIVIYENSNLDVYVNIARKILPEELADCRLKLMELQEERVKHLILPSYNYKEKQQENNEYIKDIPLSHIASTKLKGKEGITVKEEIMGQNNIAKDARWAKRAINFHAVPLEIRSKIIGILFIANFDQNITEHNKYTLNMVANQAILVLNNCQLYHRMKDMAIHDGLTGIYNHRFFQTSLEKELTRTDRHKADLFMMLLDIDYFKDYNDNYGHQKGDVLLQDISAVLTKNVREVDIVARYGGEEFAIILPHTDKKGALNVAERIRKAVEKFPFKGQHDNEIVHKTVSIGLAHYNRKKTKVDLISQADNALYMAKHSGRNTIKIAEDV